MFLNTAVFCFCLFVCLFVCLVKTANPLLLGQIHQVHIPVVGRQDHLNLGSSKLIILAWTGCHLPAWRHYVRATSVNLRWEHLVSLCAAAVFTCIIFTDPPFWLIFNCWSILLSMSGEGLHLVDCSGTEGLILSIRLNQELTFSFIFSSVWTQPTLFTSVKKCFQHLIAGLSCFCCSWCGALMNHIWCRLQPLT